MPVVVQRRMACLLLNTLQVGLHRPRRRLYGSLLLGLLLLIPWLSLLLLPVLLVLWLLLLLHVEPFSGIDST